MNRIQIAPEYELITNEDGSEWIQKIGTEALLDPTDFFVRIDIFESRTRAYFIDLACALAASDKGQYASLMLSLGYFEFIEQFRKGMRTPKDKSGDYFRDSARRIFGGSLNQDEVDRLWSEVRNGVMHSYHPRGVVWFVVLDTPIRIWPACGRADKTALLIDVARVADCVRRDFSAYIAELRKDEAGTLASDFNSLWEECWESW